MEEDYKCVTIRNRCLDGATEAKSGDPSSLRIWTRAGWRQYILSGKYSEQACLADEAPCITSGTISSSVVLPPESSFVIPKLAWQPKQVCNEHDLLANLAESEPHTQEVCLFMVSTTSPGKPLVAPGGRLPAAVTSDDHPAETAWKLARSISRRDDFSSFHRFAVTWHRTDKDWYRILYYTTAPDEDSAFEPALPSSLDDIFLHSPIRHTRMIRQSPFLKKAIT